MKLFGKPNTPQPGEPPRPVVLALLEGWGADARGPAMVARTPAFNRLAQRFGMLEIEPGPAPRSFASSVAAIAQGQPPQVPDARLEALFRADGGIGANPAVEAFIKRLNHVGGDCHILCVLTPSGLEGRTAHAAKLAATLSHEGIRVWVHAILDGRDAPSDGALMALREFTDDVAGAGQVRLATVAGRAHALDVEAGAEALAAVRNAMVDAMPQAETALGEYIDEQNRRGVSDADIKPASDPAYPGMRSDDALLILHPQPAGMAALVEAIAPEGGLDVPSTGRPITLSARRRILGWPAAGDQALAPLETFEPARPLLPHALAENGVPLLIAGPHRGATAISVDFEGCTPSASRMTRCAGPVDVADTIVKAVKAGAPDFLTAFLSGPPSAARGSDASQARKFAELQDKALGRIASTLERKGGLLIAVGTDRSLGAATATHLPLIAAVPSATPEKISGRGTLDAIAPTVLALLGLDAPAAMTGTPLPIFGRTQPGGALASTG